MDTVTSKFKEVSLGSTSLDSEVGYTLLRVAEDSEGRVATLSKAHEDGSYMISVESPFGTSQSGYTTLEEATGEWSRLL